MYVYNQRHNGETPIITSSQCNPIGSCNCFPLAVRDGYTAGVYNLSEVCQKSGVCCIYLLGEENNLKSVEVTVRFLKGVKESKKMKPERCIALR